MSFTSDPMYIVNLVLCIIILALGCWGYRKTGDKVPLYVGVAFGPKYLVRQQRMTWALRLTSQCPKTSSKIGVTLP